MTRKKIFSDKEYQFEFRKSSTSILALIPNMESINIISIYRNLLSFEFLSHKQLFRLVAIVTKATLTSQWPFYQVKDNIHKKLCKYTENMTNYTVDKTHKQFKRIAVP